MLNDFCILISSCDNYSDLWPMHFQLLKEHWKGELPPIYLVTDKKTEFREEGVTVFDFDGNMPIRLRKACSLIKEKYLLVTLDDYFLIEDIVLPNFEYYLDYIIAQSVDYLLLYDRRFTKKKQFKTCNDISKIDLEEKYAVNLYPAIWNKGFLFNCVDENVSPWEFEPNLSKKALLLDARCCSNIAGSFIILDVIRKGRVLHKANAFFKKNGIDIGNRPLISRKTELKLATMDFVKFHFPKRVVKVLKRIAKKFGMKFYDND